MHLVSRILQPPKWLAGFRRANRTRRKGHLAIGRDLERLEERQLLSTIFMTPDHTAFLSAGSMATSLPGAFAETLGGTTNRSVSSGSMNVVLPAAPSFTATAVSASQINLTWTGVAGATSYFVDQWTGSAWTQVASLGSGSTSYAVNGLSPNTTYYFDVAASNAAGTTWANYQGATTRAATLTPPAAPAFTATAVSATQINLTWTGVAGATSYFVDQ
ncbi:MAG: fibronectin type III domain-containing protein [Planctomycetaceae bacterium]|nr:fibronectin type III domain-containing protein [Planctomycetaceae bacterium]